MVIFILALLPTPLPAGEYFIARIEIPQNIPQMQKSRNIIVICYKCFARY